jgi:multidrug efflux pump subunit AcrB
VVEVEHATAELVAPIVGSTLTTVVVFAPLGLLSGIVGQFFRALSLTLTAAVLASLVLSLTLIPLLARAIYRPSPDHGEVPESAARPGRLERAYVASLPRVVNRPVVAILGLLLLAALAVIGYSRVGTGFLPEADEGGFVLDYVTPAGSSIEDTNAHLQRIDRILTATPEIASYSRRTGSELGMFATQINSGDILVRLKSRGERQRSADEIIADLRDRIGEAVPDTEIEFVQLLQDMLGDLEGSPDPIEVKVFGDDPAVLADLEAQIGARISKIDGIVDVVTPTTGTPEVTWTIDPLKAAQIGLTVDQVATQLSAAWSGQVATDLRLLDRTIPVRVRFPDAYRLSPDKLRATPIRGAAGQLTPAAALAEITSSAGQEELLRENLRQMGLVTARLENRDLGSGVADVRAAVANLKLPVGYTLEIGGQYDSQRQAFQQLLLVFAIGASLVYLVLVIQFRRFIPALLILAAAPLSLGGAFLLLAVTGTDLNVSSAMGLILLVGLAVKNGIVLLDFADMRRAEGLPLRDAVLAAARVRLRPILMTTLCTLFGLAPLAVGLGAGAELQKPLALAVIGGLTLSTFVTLYLVPAAYVAWTRDSQVRTSGF